MPTIHLVDGSYYFYRAYFTLPPELTDPQGMPVAAIFGVLSTISDWIVNSDAKHLAIAFDSKSFRHELYPEYKANRKEKLPGDALIQFQRVGTVLKDMGFAVFKSKGFEADDIIGTLARHFAQSNQVVIHSCDKDFFQLLDDPNITQERDNRQSTTTFDAQRVKMALGVEPEQVVDYLAIVGDSSDNIPGIRGIGPKYAGKILSKFGSLKNLYGNLEQLPEKQRIKFQDQKKNVKLFRKLARLATVPDLELNCSDVEFQYSDRVKQQLDRLGIRKLHPNKFRN